MSLVQKVTLIMSSAISFFVGMRISAAYQSQVAMLEEGKSIGFPQLWDMLKKIGEHPLAITPFNLETIGFGLLFILIVGAICAIVRFYNKTNRERYYRYDDEEYEPMPQYPKQHYVPAEKLQNYREEPVEDKTPDVEVHKFDTDNNSGPGALESLNDLIGLDTVKREVSSLINFVNIQKMRTAQGLSDSQLSNHMVFTGNPGTGKTTVARFISQALYEIGVLSKGHLVEVDRSHMVAEYVGQTAPLVRNIVKKAMGGVLFIDEAYSITSGGQGDYGAEAIATLLKCMEDSRSNLIVIVAGYQEPMEQFVNANPGLRSRFNRFIDFPNYSPHELLQIFGSFCEQHNYYCEETLSEELFQYFEDSIQDADDTFANGRFVRNTFESVLLHQANRLSNVIAPNADQLSEIKLEDFESAIGRR